MPSKSSGPNQRGDQGKAAPRAQAVRSQSKSTRKPASAGQRISNPPQASAASSKASTQQPQAARNRAQSGGAPAPSGGKLPPPPRQHGRRPGQQAPASESAGAAPMPGSSSGSEKSPRPSEASSAPGRSPRQRRRNRGKPAAATASSNSGPGVLENPPFTPSASRTAPAQQPPAKPAPAVKTHRKGRRGNHAAQPQVRLPSPEPTQAAAPPQGRQPSPKPTRAAAPPQVRLPSPEPTRASAPLAPPATLPKAPKVQLTDDPELLAERVLELIRERAPKSLDKVEITKRLGLKPDARNLIREALREHEEAGRIVHASGGSYSLPAAQGLIEGTFSAHEGGFGFVITGDPEQPDIFIPERHTANALHRDRVLVRLRRPRGEDSRGGKKGKKDRNAPKPKGGHDPLPGEKLEGEIVRILKRANPTLVGTILRDSRSRHMLLTPDETRISRPVQVLPLPGTHLPSPHELHGKKVLVRLLEWDSPWDPLKGELIEVLGDASDPEVATQALIRKYRLPLEFPDDVQAEANDIPARIAGKEIERRLDLRQEYIFTIDPETARDFDDAIHIYRTKDGGYEAGIHIADVSNYVYPGTALDREARVRGNSTYLVDRVIPMIPERLSNGICSLVPNEERLTRSVLLKLDSKGRVTQAKFAETVILSKVRLTYQQALALLEHPDGSAISDAVNLAWECAAKVRERRFYNGALDLDFPDVSVILDDAGHPVELRREENDISHQLIEEFMLLANEAVAKATKERSQPSIYRIHDEPDEAKLAEFRMVLQSYGFTVGDLTQRKELQKFLAQLRGHAEEGALKVALLKSLKRAAYDVKPAGHYGLAKDDYTHFTSPIRRYADLVVHRVLLKIIEKKPTKRQSTLSAGQMAKVAEHISETERIATEAERESKKLKQLEYLQRLIDKAPKGTTLQFPAVVTDIRNFGAFVELPDMLISGLLRGQDLRDWGFFPDSGRGGYVNRRTDQLLRIGSKITVEVMEIDLIRKQVNFLLVQEEGAKPKTSGKATSTKKNDSRRGNRR